MDSSSSAPSRAASAPVPASGARGERRPPDPARRAAAFATALVLFGSFLPWIDTALGDVSGMRGPGLWTFYAAMLGLAGVLLPNRRLATLHVGLMGVVAAVLPVWQALHLLSLVGTVGWRPGPGLVVVLGGGVLALSAAWRLRRPAPVLTPRSTRRPLPPG